MLVEAKEADIVVCTHAHLRLSQNNGSNAKVFGKTDGISFLIVDEDPTDGSVISGEHGTDTYLTVNPDVLRPEAINEALKLAKRIYKMSPVFFRGTT